MSSTYGPPPSLAPPDSHLPPNFNSHPTLGGLSRSSRQNSLAVLASAPSSGSTSPLGSSSPGSSTAHSSFGLTAASSPPSSTYSTSAGNSGFIVTSRPKVYKPPPSPNAGQEIPLPSPSPPLPGANLSHNASLSSRRSQSPPPAPERKPSHASSKSSGRGGANSPPSEPKTTLTLSSSIDSQGRRMVNQYVRLKTIGQGSHGKVWLCAEPTLRESDEDELDDAEAEEDAETRARRRKGKSAQARSEQWEEEIDSGDVRYCAIKSVAREGAGRGKSLRAAKGRKASSQGSAGIGADDKIKREVAIMKRLDHPNIVRLKEVIDDVKSKKVFMVLEFMAGGQIVWQDDNKRPTMTVDEARRTFRDVVLGLEYLHYQGIIHRDIKPANLLWTEDHSVVKISDFGVSHVSEALLRASPLDTTDCPPGEDDKALRKTAGSPAFFAPELCHPVDYTPTPTHAPANDSDSTYFPSGAQASTSPAASTSDFPTPLSPSGVPLTSTVISLPLPLPSSSHPRPRPPIGKGIDVWALGVTLFCLLFGDTPFMARTEYELYNVIAREGVRIPERMGKEGAWTGVPTVHQWEGMGDGEEGREVVDLLGRLLEKNPEKRISLEEVKKHPWVLRNLEASPDSWLCDTDPAQTDTVIVTEEDIQHATHERGAVDTLPPIRNRPGIRRALNAALVRFPAFARIKSSRRADATPRSRSKSASSTSQSAEHDHQSTNVTLSRFPTDEATGPHRKKSSLDFGVDIRRIISSEQSGNGPHSRSSSPAGTINGRGGWGNWKRDSTPTTPNPPTTNIQVVVDPEYTPSPRSPAPNLVPLPNLSRSVSSSSVPSNGRGGFSHHLLGSRKNSERSDSSVRGSSTPSSDGESTMSGRRTLSRMLSKLGGGERRGGGRTPHRQSSLSDEGDDEVASAGTPSGIAIPAALVERFETTGDKYDSLGRVVKSSAGTTEHGKSQRSFVRPAPEDDDEEEEEDDDEELMDLTEFEYSESDESDDEDLEDDLVASPIDVANGISGWHSSFANFGLGEGEGGDALFAEVDGEFQKPLTTTLEDSTPRQSAHQALATKGIDPDPSLDPPPLVHQHSNSDSPTRTVHKLAIPSDSGYPSYSPSSASPTDGSIRAVSLEPPSSRRDEMFGEDDEDEDAGIVMAPRRRRATTVSGL